MLDRHIAARYGVRVDAVREFEPGGGVFHVAGPDWVVRVFPPNRPVASAEHDARVLATLESANVPAERPASDNPVSVLDDGRALLATSFVPGRQCRGVRDADLLAQVADVLGRVHALPVPDEIRAGGGWHLASAPLGTRADDIAALLPRINHERLRHAVESIDCGTGLPEALVHPDPSGANVIHAGSGEPVLIDWTGAGRGPRLLSFAVLLGAALEAQQLAGPILRSYTRHVELTEEEVARLPGALCGFALLVGAWMHATFGTAAEPIVAAHDQRTEAADSLARLLG